jgi:small subunit ribosomal protein S16
VATKIRLKRLGKIRTPHYRVVVMDSRTKRDGRPIEEIGQYHPKSDPSIISIDSERARYWLGVGAQPTEAVIALLKRTGDWQAVTGDTSPSGVDERPSRPDKEALFNAALAEADNEPGAEAISRGRRGRKAEDAAEAITEALEGKVTEDATDEASAPSETV